MCLFILCIALFFFLLEENVWPFHYLILADNTSGVEVVHVAFHVVHSLVVFLSGDGGSLGEVVEHWEVADGAVDAVQMEEPGVVFAEVIEHYLFALGALLALHFEAVLAKVVILDFEVAFFL